MLRKVRLFISLQAAKNHFNSLQKGRHICRPFLLATLAHRKRLEADRLQASHFVMLFVKYS
jgi:hypothetical protein